MPVQHFAQPAASTIDTDQPITEIRWDFGYDTLEILESGNVIAQICDPNILLSSGIAITANNGHRFVIHVKKDVSAGPFAIYRDDIELVGGIPSWGVASSVAGKLVHLPNDIYQEKLSIRNNLERPIRIAQSWLGFSSLVAIVFASLAGIGNRFVPTRFLSSLETPLFSGAIAALSFMALALAIQKRTAFFVVPIAQIFTIVEAVFIGNELLKSPAYPHFGAFRLFICALTFWVTTDCWKTIRRHRAKARETRKHNLIGLSEIEKITVRDLAKVTEERGHLLAWQQPQGSESSEDQAPSRQPQEGELTFPSTLDLLPDGLDPFDQTSVPSTSSQVALSSGPSPAQPGWINRPVTLSPQPAAPLTAPLAFTGVTVTAPAPDVLSPVPPVGTASPSAMVGTLRLSRGQSAFGSAPTSAPLQAPGGSSSGLMPGSTTGLATGLATEPKEPASQGTTTAPKTQPSTSATAAFPFLAPAPPLQLENPWVSTGAEVAGQHGQAITVSAFGQPEAWVPPTTTVEETVEPAKPGPAHHPLRARVRAGL
jgi:hypothetical protein